MAWENEKTGWFKISEGDVTEFTVEKITEKEPTGKINPIPNKKYYYEFDTDKGTLTINNLGFFQALVTSNVREGDRIRVHYLKKGTVGKVSTYKIEILSKGDEVDLEQPPTEDNPPF